jgi:hypothetical protein
LDDEWWCDGSRWRELDGERGKLVEYECVGMVQNMELQLTKTYLEFDEDEYGQDICDECNVESCAQELVAAVSEHWLVSSSGELTTEGRKIETEICLACGLVTAVLDTAAFSIWMDAETFEKAKGFELAMCPVSAVGVDGSSLDVLGHGIVTFQWWGRVFEGVTVCILRRMLSRVLIVRKTGRIGGGKIRGEHLKI